MGNWKVLFFICAFMLVFAIVFQSIPPVVGFLIDTLGITHAQAGALMSLFGLPGIFISIPGGILADIHGAKKVGLVSLALTLIGSLLVALGSSFSLLVVGRIIAGVGALTISIVAPQTLSRRFTQQDMGKVMGIFNSVMPFGTIVTLNTFGRLAAFASWRLPLLLASTYTFFILIYFYLKYPAMPGEGEEHGTVSMKESISYLKKTKLPVWLIAGIWLFYNAGSIAYLSFAGDYYVSVGYSPSYAGFLSSLLMIGALILSPVVGYLTDRYGREEYVLLFGNLAVAVLFWLVPRTVLNPVYLGILIGIAASCIPAPVFSLLPSFLPPERMGLGYGILASLLNIGVLIGPLLVGYYYDQTANYLPGFSLMALFILLSSLLALFLVVVKRRQHQGELG